MRSGVRRRAPGGARPAGISRGRPSSGAREPTRPAHARSPRRLPVGRRRAARGRSSSRPPGTGDRERGGRRILGRSRISASGVRAQGQVAFGLGASCGGLPIPNSPMRRVGGGPLPVRAQAWPPPRAPLRSRAAPLPAPNSHGIALAPNSRGIALARAPDCPRARPWLGIPNRAHRSAAPPGPAPPPPRTTPGSPAPGGPNGARRWGLVRAGGRRGADRRASCLWPGVRARRACAARRRTSWPSSMTWSALRWSLTSSPLGRTCGAARMRSVVNRSDARVTLVGRSMGHRAGALTSQCHPPRPVAFFTTACRPARGSRGQHGREQCRALPRASPAQTRRPPINEDFVRLFPLIRQIDPRGRVGSCRLDPAAPAKACVLADDGGLPEACTISVSSCFTGQARPAQGSGSAIMMLSEPLLAYDNCLKTVKGYPIQRANEWGGIDGHALILCTISSGGRSGCQGQSAERSQSASVNYQICVSLDNTCAIRPMLRGTCRRIAGGPLSARIRRYQSIKTAYNM